MKDYKTISEKALDLLEYQSKLIYEYEKLPNTIGREWRLRVEGLETIIKTFANQLKELQTVKNEKEI